jgi:crossover junction endodeoxyribonuclease RuvC
MSGCLSMRILGLDPALRTTGYGAIEASDRRCRLVEAGIIAPPSHKPLEERLALLYEGVAAVLDAVAPSVIVIEDLYATYRSPRTAILMGHARGVLCLAGAQAGIPVRTLGHAHVKRALTGSGSASKEHVNTAVMHELALQRAPRPFDVSDALALALAYARLQRGERLLAGAR